MWVCRISSVFAKWINLTNIYVGFNAAHEMNKNIFFSVTLHEKWQWRYTDTHKVKTTTKWISISFFVVMCIVQSQLIIILLFFVYSFYWWTVVKATFLLTLFFFEMSTWYSSLHFVSFFFIIFILFVWFQHSKNIVLVSHSILTVTRFFESMESNEHMIKWESKTLFRLSAT